MNAVLWTIDNELDGIAFQRLCVDLLYRNGYLEIVPIEPQDGGRDAEEFPRRGRGRHGEAAFFQFSLEERWRPKLRHDMRRLSERGYEFSTLVFVTSRKVRGVDKDDLEKECREKYGWDLFVYSREWLRLQLEEAHPDLAKKYLGVDLPWPLRRAQASVHFTKSSAERLSDAWKAFDAGLYDRAAADFRDFLEEQPEGSQLWQALAWAQYCLHRYDEGLASINRALKLQEDPQGIAIRACILAEHGIREGNRPSIVEAWRLFQHILASQGPTWQTLYNLGNVLDALGDHQGARDRYSEALDRRPGEPMILKNLASVYHSLGHHDQEIQYLDQVLEIDPMHPEALVSKGVSLLVDFDKPADAVAVLERALTSRNNWGFVWPHIWYWLGDACRRSGQPQRALGHVDEGLNHRPGHLGLRRLKSDVLEQILATAPDRIEEARRFWSHELSEQPLDYVTRSRLVRLEAHQGNTPAAWQLLDDCFPLMDLGPVLPLQSSPFTIEECIQSLCRLPQYRVFRKRYPVSDYWKRDDPLYDLPFAPPSSDQLQAALTAYFAVPFGLGIDQCGETPAGRESKESLTQLFECVRPGIERALTEGARHLAGLIPSRTMGHSAVAEKLTEIIMFLGLVALSEFGRQRGWIAAQFHIPPNALERAMDGYDENMVQKTVVANALTTLNEIAHFAPP